MLVFTVWAHMAYSHDAILTVGSLEEAYELGVVALGDEQEACTKAEFLEDMKSNQACLGQTDFMQILVVQGDLTAVDKTIAGATIHTFTKEHAPAFLSYISNNSVKK